MSGIDEGAMTGANRYYMQAQMHDQAGRKYAVSAKSASVDPDAAKRFRKAGKLHSQVAALINKLAGIHTDHEHSTSLAQKDAKMTGQKPIKEATGEHAWHVMEMHPEHGDHGISAHASKEEAVEHVRDRGIFGNKHPRFIVHEHPDGHVEAHNDKGERAPHLDKRINEEEVMDDEIYTIDEALSDAVVFALEGHPIEFAETITDLIRARALERVEDIKVDLARETFNDDVDQVDELYGKGDITYLKSAHKDKEAMAVKAMKHRERKGDSNGAEAFDAKASYHSVSQDRATRLRDRANKFYGKKDRQDAADDREQARDARNRYHGLKHKQFGEDVEQVNELSRKKLTDYVSKAVDDKVDATERHFQGKPGRKPGQGQITQFLKRGRGIDKALKRLATEDVDNLDELHGKGSISKIQNYHDDEADKHDPDSNAGDYHTAQSDRASSIRNRLNLHQQMKRAKQDGAEHRQYVRDRKRVMKKEGPGSAAREI